MTPRVRPLDAGGGRLLAGILIGGRSSRMGRPKQLIHIAGRSLFGRVAGVLGPFVESVVAVGSGALPPRWCNVLRVPDIPHVDGPGAGVLGAMRWDPTATWLIASCDLPDLSSLAVAWLLSQRDPDRDAVLPWLEDGRPQPLLAVYEPASRPLLEDLVARGAGPAALADISSVAVIPVPAPLRAAWVDVDTPGDLERHARRG